MDSLEQTTNLQEVAEPEAPAAPPEKLTRKQLGQLRRQYMTVTHGTVRACGHLARFSKDHDPKNNCISCWGAYFSTSVDLDLLSEVLREALGRTFLEYGLGPEGTYSKLYFKTKNDQVRSYMKGVTNGLFRADDEPTGSC